jgi:hypothetical protein
MERTGCLVCFISTAKGCSQKEEKKAIKNALVAGTLQTLSNLFRDFQYLCATLIDIREYIDCSLAWSACLVLVE